MKKLILCGSTLLLSLGLAKAQTPGAFVNYAYDDFQNTTGYSTNNAGLFWYSGNATPATQHGDRSSGTKAVFTYTTAAANYMSVDFGHNVTGFSKNTLDLTNMADIEIDIENTSTKDLVLRLYLADSLPGLYGNGNILEIEPNISDCAAAGTDITYTTPSLTWVAPYIVYPTPSDLNAVYPRVAYNGFVLAANTRKTYRIDLSSVAGAVGGLFADVANSSSAVDASPATKTGTNSGFKINLVHSVQFSFNENTIYNLSDGAVDKTCYKFDVTDVPAQNNWTGSITLHSFKVGNILSALPSIATTAIKDDAVVDNSLKVYPNPAKESLNVSFDATTGATISLSDLAGHMVYSTSAGTGSNNITINTSAVPTGMYILNIATANGVTARKVSIR